MERGYGSELNNLMPKDMPIVQRCLQASYPHFYQVGGPKTGKPELKFLRAFLINYGLVKRQSLTSILFFGIVSKRRHGYSKVRIRLV